VLLGGSAANGGVHALDMSADIRAFIAANEAQLKAKD
jgi:hypothetical protein